jgi:integrase/recombinase XerD
MAAPIKTDEQFQEVFSYVSLMQEASKYRLMLLLSVKLGLRPMEIAGLQSAWFAGGELCIPRGYSKRKTGRSLPVSEEILEALDAYLQGRTGLVFLNRQGQAFTALGITKAMSRLYREAGQVGSCYSGRRTLATRLVDEGTNILVVQKVLGHSSPATTMAYVGVTPSMMNKALFG